MERAPGPALAATARWTAAVRARETLRADRLLDDPWAAALAGAAGEEWAAGRPEESLLAIALRTRFFDDFLQRVAVEGSLRQIVLLASGLDTRAFRLPWPEGTRLFELDRDDVLRHKERVLAGARPRCDRRAIGVDLRDPWTEALIEAGFDARRPSGWLLEGFLFYLTRDRMESILGEVSALAAAGSEMGFDVINAAMLTSEWTRKWIEMQAASGAPWIGTMDDPVGFLAALGWKASLSQAGASDAHHGRWSLPVLPVTMAGVPHNWFVTGVKAAA